MKFNFVHTVVPLLQSHPTCICQETVATLERWPSLRGRHKYIDCQVAIFYLHVLETVARCVESGH